MRFSLLPLLLAGCATAPLAPRPTPSCVTFCGLKAQLPPASCAALQAAETRAREVFDANVPDFRPPEAVCRAFKGWRVEVHTPHTGDGCGSGREPRAWTDGILNPRCVLALTHLDRHLIEIDTPDWKTNSLTHELAHVLDYAFGAPDTVDHCGWEKKGVKAALLEATGVHDETPETCD